MLRVFVISPEASLFEGDATAVVATAFDGEVGILTGHAPMMTLLGKGQLVVSAGSGEPRRFIIEGGFMQVLNNEVRVVTEHGASA